jgi:hypothetical protein
MKPKPARKAPCVICGGVFTVSAAQWSAWDDTKAHPGLMNYVCFENYHEWFVCRRFACRLAADALATAASPVLRALTWEEDSDVP